MRALSKDIGAVLLAAIAFAYAATWPMPVRSDDDQVPVPIEFEALESHGIEMSSSVSKPMRPQMSFRATVTGYSAEPGQTDETPNITASGERVHAGGIACPVRFPFGTRVRIAGTTYTCNDRMNPRYQHTDRFDIFFPVNADAIRFGVQHLKVQIES